MLIEHINNILVLFATLSALAITVALLNGKKYFYRFKLASLLFYLMILPILIILFVESENILEKFIVIFLVLMFLLNDKKSYILSIFKTYKLSLTISKSPKP